MEGKRLVWTTVITVILAFSATAIIMFRVDPYEAGIIEKSLFYTSFLIGVAGLVKIIFRKYFW